MPQTPHIEKHFSANQLVRDIVIGMSDGLTVPFALAAGLTGAVAASHIIITAGLAEIAAGGISMGLGGYLAGKGDVEYYASEEKREYSEVDTVPEKEEQEIVEIFESYGLSKEEIRPITKAFKNKPAKWVDFMMRFELNLEKADPNRALQSARNISISYIVGGLVPLAPYIFVSNIGTAFPLSVAATLLALAVFGFVKGHFTGTRPWRSALNTVIVGGLAAGAAFLIARFINQ